MAEQKAGGQGDQKRFRSSAAPKGTKLANGYVDRTQMRTSSEGDEKAERVKALEEMMKLQQIDEATFIQLRDEILGGDVASTHLVKGLDYKLLERVRRGEDVLQGKEEEEPSQSEEQLDDAFEELAEKDTIATQKSKKEEKKGVMAPPSLVPGRKRNRDQILAEMKAARQAALQPSLGSKFKKVGDKKFQTRLERDGKGREILITVDEHGNEKRKVRKTQVEPEPEPEKVSSLLMPDKNAQPLGMVVPARHEVSQEVVEDLNIFEDVGDEYDPLAGLEDNSDDEIPSHTNQPGANGKGESANISPPVETTSEVPKQNHDVSEATKPRNYFGETRQEHEVSKSTIGFSDPMILAALKKASTLNPITQVFDSDEEAAKEARRRKMLQRDDRDDMDIDIGFGSSKFADEEDFDEKKVKLSKWGQDDGDEDTGKGGDKSKRKRGPKKRKGDVNSAADVLQAMERRKAAGK